MSDTVTFWVYVVLVATYLSLLPLLLRSGWRRLRQAATTRLPAARWLTALSFAPAAPAAVPTAPSSLVHEGVRFLIVGAPGNGKTTVTRQVVREFMIHGAQVAVLDPDGSAWPRGAEIIGAPDDWEAISGALTTVTHIAARRRAEFQRGERVFAPLVIVVEEAPAVLKHVANAVATLDDISARGRKLNISLIIIAQDTGAKTLNLEGLTKILNRFQRFDVRKAARTIEMLRDGQVMRTLAFAPETDLELPPAPETVVESPTVAPVTPPVVLPIPTRRERSSDPVFDAERLLRDALATPMTAVQAPALSADAPLPALNDVASAVTAVERGETSRNDVSLPDVAVAEIARIAYLLASLPPSEVTKRLDGYTPKRYAEFRHKVDAVRALLKPSIEQIVTRDK